MDYVAILGAHGQLGRQLQKVYPDAFCPTTSELDITDSERVQRLADYDLVINCAAYHDLLKCEENPEIAFMVNSVAVFQLGLICKKLIHISTNYVFDGKSLAPYKESDIPNPISVYGKSKYAGELMLDHSKHLIVRTAGLYGPGGPSGKGFNFVDAVAQGKYTKIKDNEYTNLTSCSDLAKAIKRHSDKVGVIHLANEPWHTWYILARAIRKDIEPVVILDKLRPESGVLSSQYDTGMKNSIDMIRYYLKHEATT